MLNQGKQCDMRKANLVKLKRSEVGKGDRIISDWWLRSLPKKKCLKNQADADNMMLKTKLSRGVLHQHCGDYWVATMFQHTVHMDLALKQKSHLTENCYDIFDLILPSNTEFLKMILTKNKKNITGEHGFPCIRTFLTGHWSKVKLIETC